MKAEKVYQDVLLQLLNEKKTVVMEDKEIFRYIADKCRSAVREAERMYDEGFSKSGIIGMLMGNLNGIAHWAEWGKSLSESNNSSSTPKLPEK